MESRVRTPERSVVGGGASGFKKARGQLVLECVAVRGKDVIGVRHLGEGATAWVGQVPEAFVRLVPRESGGEPVMVGEVRDGAFRVNVPQRARGRVHPLDGVPRLVMGPHRVVLSEGERAVVVLGPVHIRFQVVTAELSTAGLRMTLGIIAWIAVLAVLYIVALSLSMSFSNSPRPPAPLPARAGSVAVPGLPSS